MSPEEHVAKGIECHENGSLQESTYHLRVAAMQNHPTAMLLYALACRHGWGMRPNQREGVQWLRKALDSAMTEFAEDETPSSTAAVREIHDRKTRRAQFALGVYELGVSHLNGWGIEEDRGLALRCFEVAALWGDVDAMSEAGFCHAEGIGCKRNMKQAARFYRMAERRGVSMVGNSW
jgi:TPR repeat protein